MRHPYEENDMIHLVITYHGKEVREEYDDEQLAREDMATLIENGFDVRVEYQAY